MDYGLQLATSFFISPLLFLYFSLQINIKECKDNCTELAALCVASLMMTAAKAKAQESRCATTSKESSCETAFAFGDRNRDGYLDIVLGDRELDDLPGIDANRWGWQLAVDNRDEFTVPVYADARQNDISKGTNVGTLSVKRTGPRSFFPCR
jgi:hypothetical protein